MVSGLGIWGPNYHSTPAGRQSGRRHKHQTRFRDKRRRLTPIITTT